jgi:hypothetical protein
MLAARGILNRSDICVNGKEFGCILDSPSEDRMRLPGRRVLTGADVNNMGSIFGCLDDGSSQVKLRAADALRVVRKDRKKKAGTAGG